ncbi:hypothetical protein Moror_3085 [Moniliophthora roreri MCA 2997]|uniref:AB hydrolase-1 domain-containing protein n=1 Tax=Moniliophthora roreri (strain MCA 2997) TaxID=1381753 RepID=V2X795_MONRO|nr:hypothetical protein Moror_3085 [Moniliophthora roreri MCA 2997]KAI3605808.1 hypothetical protein WG66_012366 [Moniliophthora roreri]
MNRTTKTLLTTACILVCLTRGAVSQATWNESSWLSITPTQNLTWVPCYDGGLECGRFQVPLNYADPEGQSAAIALVRMKANVSADSTDYLGPILFNPGGPGGSGVDYIVSLGTKLREILGPQFDLVGFDPRGVSRSTPRVTIYETLDERLSWQRSGIWELNSSLQDNVASYWARAKIIAQLAEERHGDFLPYINTDHTARDMLRITEAYGREKLQYWGISYGTALGSTFAAMFPDKVQRLVIDGVLDVQDDYYTMGWKDVVSDTDATLKWFFKDCHDAGAEKCSFYESSAEAIEERLNRLYQSIIRAPVPVRGAGLIDYASLRFVIFNALYYPLTRWSTLATALADLEKGNGTTLAQMSGLVPSSSPDSDDAPVSFANNDESQTVIVCNDGDAVPPSLEHAQQHYEESLKVSEWGSMSSAMRIKCSGWPNIPKAPFRGPISGNTSHPILLIGNTADPITPLSAAHKVSKGFPGSVVLQQDCAGHTSILAGPSVCTYNIIREYFVNGTLPEPGTVCPIEGSPF